MTTEKTLQNQQPSTLKRNPNRRERRAALKNLFPKRNDGKFKFSGTRQMMAVWNDQAIYLPKHKKLKGYEKERRKTA